MNEWWLLLMKNQYSITYTLDEDKNWEVVGLNACIFQNSISKKYVCLDIF